MTDDEPFLLAQRLHEQGDEAGALAAFERAARAAHQQFDPATEAKAMLGAGDVRRLLGDAAGARDAYEEAIARAMEGGERLVEADAHFALALVAFDQGHSKDGHDALLEAMALYRDEGGDEAKWRLARAVRHYGEHLGVLGSTPEARQALELARAMFTDLGDRAAADGIADDLARLADYAR